MLYSAWSVGLKPSGCTVLANFFESRYIQCLQNYTINQDQPNYSLHVVNIIYRL